MDDPEWHIYYAVRTGIRYTGMPAWNKTLSEQDMWKVTAFLSRIEKAASRGGRTIEENPPGLRRPPSIPKGNRTDTTTRGAGRITLADIYLMWGCAV